MSRTVVTGGTGMIGREVVARLLQHGDVVVVLTRSLDGARELRRAGIELVAWPEPASTQPPLDSLWGADRVVNLLGEPIAQRWSADVKQRIRDSRVLATRNLVQALGTLPAAERPKVLVSQSATGYYGPCGAEELDESAPVGADFLAGVVKDWETAALAAAEHGLRVAVTRTGVVLSRDGGALKQMMGPFKLGLGGPVAGGRQYLSWIHLTDVAGAILKCLFHDTASGPVNVTAPQPVTNGEFSKTLGRVLHRPAIVPVPEFALKLLYGEMAEVVTTGQRAVPKRLLEYSYAFRHPELEPALRETLR